MSFHDIVVSLADFIWGTPLVVLLTGGGLYFAWLSKGIPYRYFRHSINILSGKYDDPDQPGEINQLQAVSTALASTIGMGNISGVAVAISMGGPGAVFWMWISALIGMSTKFFTCSLAVMYRQKDLEGKPIGGPMYYIVNGMGKKWKPMAVFFSLAGMIGVAPFFQANQLARIIGLNIAPNGSQTQLNYLYLVLGIMFSILVMLVVFGGIKRIARVASNLVPFMVILYFFVVILILVLNSENILPAFYTIFSDAFTGNAVAGGAVGAVIYTGIRRAAFSNEAGIGTAPMAHGEARTSEPIREGLAAMTEPFIDTIIVCTLTALAIVVTGVWQTSEFDGIRLTALAFEKSLPGVGMYLLTASVSVFAITSLFSFPYYGSKCFAFVFGQKYKRIYELIYCGFIIMGAVLSLGSVISIADAFYGLMAFPNMIAALWLAPKVIKAAREYFRKLESSNNKKR
ncbi:MAG: alanine/glycine:cation symporter family protein [Candidatus Cyclobacteriaceae bacterium M3_2C_046]